MEEILVRKVKPAEIEQVQRLFEEVYADTFSGSIPVFEEAVEGEQLYVALIGECIAGMASVWEPDSFIHFLFVDQRSRHKKVASTLVRKLARWYEQPLTLKCLSENTEAMAFYRATGWSESGTGLCEEGTYVLFRYTAD